MSDMPRAGFIQKIQRVPNEFKTNSLTNSNEFIQKFKGGTHFLSGPDISRICTFRNPKEEVIKKPNLVFDLIVGYFIHRR